MSGCKRTEARRVARARANVQAGRRLAGALGCTCVPNVAHAKNDSAIHLIHDPWCPKADAASQILYRTNDGDLFDLGPVIDLARGIGSTVVAAREGVIVTPDGVEVADTVRTTCRATTVPGAVIYEMRTEVLADLERQIRSER